MLGLAWTPFWLDRETPPALARATVYRKGISHPITVIVSWEESLPADEAWRELWLAKPMKLFGAYVLRAALRRAFRDVIGARREPDEIDPAAPTTPPAPEGKSADDAAGYEAAIAAVQTVEDLDVLHKRMKRARAVTVQLEGKLRARRRELSEQPAGDAWTPEKPEKAEKPEQAKPAEVEKPAQPKRRRPRKGNRETQTARDESRPVASVEAAMRDALARKDRGQ
jgi:hypothetical protein